MTAWASRPRLLFWKGAAALVASCALIGVGTARADDYISYIPASGSVNPSDSIPAEIDPNGFTTLVTLVAGSYGLGIDGATDTLPGEKDGVNTIGFSYGLGPDTLGLYNWWSQRVYRSKRVCRRSHGIRHCRRVRVYQYTEVVESDIAFNATYSWNLGPGYPSSDQMDLPTVAFHEFGHWSDPNAEHDVRCSGSPLTETTGYGEWWRGPDDWYEPECDNAPSFPSTKRALRAAPRFRTVVHWLPNRVVGDHAPAPVGARRVVPVR
jgi:hypothetical protein